MSITIPLIFLGLFNIIHKKMCFELIQLVISLILVKNGFIPVTIQIINNYPSHFTIYHLSCINL